jgi:hypothetical protein
LDYGEGETDMRTTTALLVAIALASITQADAFGQCQRGGGGGSQQPSMPFQAGGIAQGGFNPILAMQQAAMQQALMQQQLAAQQMRMQQLVLREQARQAKLERRRDSAEQRRAAELARREKVRAENIARLTASKPQETFVATLKPGDTSEDPASR